MHLLVAVSAHGFGHLAQTAPVLQALHRLLCARGESLRLSVICDHPEALLQTWIALPFNRIDAPLEPGIPMLNAVDIDPAGLRANSEALLADWDATLDRMGDLIDTLRPDRVLTNSSYQWSLAAASAGIPTWNACSLNWANLMQSYAAPAELVERAFAGYNAADGFLAFTPHMPMPGIERLRSLPPVGRRLPAGRLRERLLKRSRLALISMGGMPFDLPFKSWPAWRQWTLLHTAEAGERCDQRALSQLGADWGMALADCDVLITKPGYGSFVEAVLHRKPLLYLPRGHWPEEPALLDWARRYVPCRALTREALLAGELEDSLHALQQQGTDGLLLPPEPEGAALCASILLGD